MADLGVEVKINSMIEKEAVNTKDMVIRIPDKFRDNRMIKGAIHREVASLAEIAEDIEVTKTQTIDLDLMIKDKCPKTDRTIGKDEVLETKMTDVAPI